MITLTYDATNESTYIIISSFANEEGVAVTPNELTWSLTDSDGAVINSRSEVSIATPSTSNAVVLGAVDLDTDDGRSRVFTIEGTYNSVTYGDDLPIREQAQFTIGTWVDEV